MSNTTNNTNNTNGVFTRIRGWLSPTNRRPVTSPERERLLSPTSQTPKRRYDNTLPSNVSIDQRELLGLPMVNDKILPLLYTLKGIHTTLSTMKDARNFSRLRLKFSVNTQQKQYNVSNANLEKFAHSFVENLWNFNGNNKGKDPSNFNIPKRRVSEEIAKEGTATFNIETDNTNPLVLRHRKSIEKYNIQEYNGTGAKAALEKTDNYVNEITKALELSIEEHNKSVMEKYAQQTAPSQDNNPGASLSI